MIIIIWYRLFSPVSRVRLEGEWLALQELDLRAAKKQVKEKEWKEMET